MITQQHQDRLVAQGRNELMTAWLAALPSAPGETKQREASERFTAFMQELVPQIVGVVAVGDYPAFSVKLENIDGKGKIALKAINVDEAGPALITHMGASLTLVLTNAEQFDRKRPAAAIEPDQKAMFEQGEDDEDDGEDDSTDEEVEALSDDEAVVLDDSAPSGDDFGLDLPLEPADPVGPFFSAVEGRPVKDAVGAELTEWTLLHGDQVVFEHVRGDVIDTIADALNARAAGLGRDLTPFEVRDGVLALLPPEGMGIALHAPYTTEAIQNSAAPANDDAKASRRGRLSDARKVELYHLGYDAAEAGQSVTEASAGYTDGEAKHIQRGWADQKDGKARAWERVKPKAANDDETPLYGDSPNGQDSTGKAA
ncbi:hypothetical protein [Azospirillum rugosum]|uniref:Uncharacterized protein n=1 Tax=Azospirillum rugosum TaxID=416170 RepID=A0ABS4SDT9_9PROT|nr:hypothetical protein [Azospirillum rugosum]MBP2290748.1 hypothetical protein [Azospirillum rugosum]MDQ0525637.1 hypothetical protein [Azospirillum rugosum]